MHGMAVTYVVLYILDAIFWVSSVLNTGKAIQEQEVLLYSCVGFFRYPRSSEDSVS